MSRDLTAPRVSRLGDARVGAPLALLLAVAAGLLLAQVLMSPPSDELWKMAAYFTLSGAATLGIGWAALQLADRALDISIGQRALLGSLAGAGIGFLNVLIIAELMFISTAHDLQLLIAVAGLSGVVTIWLNTWMANSITARIRRVTGGIRALARGDYAARLHAPGRDEVALLAADIDELASRLEHAERERAAVDRERRDLVASISHDLRTPLASVRAVIEALDDDVISGAADTQRYHSILRREIDRMSRMIDDLFELARIDAGAVQLKKERVALQEIAADVVDAMQVQAKQRGIALTLRDGRALPAIPVDGARIERAIANLVRNALEHTPPGGRVDIATAAANGQIELAVRDTGAGLDRAQLAEIWKPFYRGSASRTRDGASDGAGLGLAIVRGIVEAHGGSVDAASDPGCGATFTVRLPAN